MKYENLFQDLHEFDSSMKYDFYRISQHLEVKKIANKIIMEIQGENSFHNFSRKSQYRVKDYIKNLLCNFYIGFRTNRCVAIPRTKSYYSDHNNFGYSKISYEIFIFCLNFLKNKQYIGQKKGYKAFGENTKSRTSKYWALPILYEQFKNIDLSDIYSKEKEKEIIVKDKNKNRSKFKGNAETKLLRNKIKMANKLYEKFDIRTVLNKERNTTRLFPRLTAIYNNDSFEDGGRLYDMPYRGAIRFQQLSKQERARITINLEQCVELDYSRLHLKMLYAMRHIELHSDPYSFYENEDIAKRAIMIILNAKSEREAIFALKKWVRKHFGIQINTRPVIRAAKKFHKMISDCFCSGVGIKLQNYDSKLAVNIVDYFTKKGIPCLPVHDSFIVPKRFKNELKAVMLYQFRNYFKTDINIH